MAKTTVVRGIWSLEMEVDAGSFCPVSTDNSLGGRRTTDSAVCLPDSLEASEATNKAIRAGMICCSLAVKDT